MRWCNTKCTTCTNAAVHQAMEEHGISRDAARKQARKQAAAYWNRLGHGEFQHLVANDHEEEPGGEPIGHLDYESQQWLDKCALSMKSEEWPVKPEVLVRMLDRFFSPKHRAATCAGGITASPIGGRPLHSVEVLTRQACAGQRSWRYPGSADINRAAFVHSGSCGALCRG